MSQVHFDDARNQSLKRGRLTRPNTLTNLDSDENQRRDHRGGANQLSDRRPSIPGHRARSTRSPSSHHARNGGASQQA